MAVGNNISIVFGAVILIFVIVALLPDIFAEVEALDPATTDVPAWVVTILTVVIAGGFVMLVWNLFGKQFAKK